MKKLVAQLDRSMLDYDEAPKGEFISFNKIEAFQEILGLNSYDYSVEKYGMSTLLKDLTHHKIAQFMSGKDFDRVPSILSLKPCRLKSLIEALKSYGTVEIITNRTSAAWGGPDGFIARVSCLGNSLKTIYVLISDISELSPNLYPEYKNDALKETLPCVDNPIFYFHDDNLEVYQLANKINKECSVVYSNRETYVEMIVSHMNGLMTQRIRFDLDYRGNDLDLHYGEGFSKYHEELLKRIGSRDKGIVMFHGPPGTGKTHYVRRLLPDLNALEKRVILIPKNILGMIESPSFNQFMIQNFAGQKIVFIIEDAESIIAKKSEDGTYRSEVVSTLLNITDGILNDIFSIQAILTFNTNLQSIDDALLRKGRLIAKYEFGFLSREQALIFSKHLGVEIQERKAQYSLAEIYALKEAEEDDLLINQNLMKKKPALGFN